MLTAGPGRYRPDADPDSALWLAQLRASGAVHDAALIRLHELLLRIARSEVRRRAGALRLAGPEADDLAYQAAADALLAITAKLDQFRGESRFTTWAYRFVILEVSTKIGRHFWRNPRETMDEADWDRLPDRLGADPADQAQARDLVTAVRRAVEQVLTDRQRQVFVALVVHGVPLDALVLDLGTTRGAIYKMMFDARGKLRGALAADGYVGDDEDGEGPAPDASASGVPDDARAVT